MSNSRFGLRTRPGLIRSYTEGLGATAYILDDFPNAAAAYSLRRLRDNYAGSAIRVRRSSDNTEQDIAFDNNGNLDENSLTTFVGANNGFVTKWYDQSGNAKDFEQTTASYQPQIVSSGTVIKQGAKAAIDFNATNNNYLITSASVNLGTTISIFTSAILERNHTSYSRFLNGMNDLYIYVGTDTSEQIATFYGDGTAWGTVTAQSATTWLNTYRLLTTINNGNDNQYVNGTLTISRSNTLGSFNAKISLGGIYNTSGVDTFNQMWDGKVTELLIYATDRSTTRTGIENNINTYYAIY